MRLHRIFDVPFLVGVVDPEDEPAAVVPGEQPVEQGGPHSADVQEAGRAGSEPGSYTHGVFRGMQVLAAGRNPGVLDSARSKRLVSNELGSR